MLGFVCYSMGEAKHYDETNPFAIASLTLGILSLFLFFLTAIPGLILGIVALIQISEDEKQKGKGQAIAGIILSLVLPWVSMIFMFVLVFLILGTSNSGIPDLGLGSCDAYYPFSCSFPEIQNGIGTNGLDVLSFTISSQALTDSYENKITSINVGGQPCNLITSPILIDLDDRSRDSRTGRIKIECEGEFGNSKDPFNGNFDIKYQTNEGSLFGSQSVSFRGNII
jgi:hypothetical protein